jgi:hypothetical protein
MSGNGTLTTVPDGVSVLVTTVCVLALCCCLHATSRCLINSFAFLPPGRSSLNPGPIRYGPSDATVWLRNAYGTELAAILYSPPLSANNSGIYILFSHGNAEDIGGRDSDLRRMARDLACHILSYDYSGYGHSKGKPGAAAMYADSEAALSYLLNERGVNPDRLLVFGVSLGTVPSGEMPIWNSLHACGQLGRSTRITLCFSPQLLSPSTCTFLDRFSQAGQLESNSMRWADSAKSACQWRPGSFPCKRAACLHCCAVSKLVCPFVLLLPLSIAYNCLRLARTSSIYQTRVSTATALTPYLGRPYIACET